MNDYILIALFILFIFFKENILNFEHVKWLHYNYSTIKFVIKNIVLSIPFLTIYFKQDDIINSFKKNKALNEDKNKRNVGNTVKKLIAANQQWKCNKCQNLLDASYEVDHIVPLYKNGTNHVNNLQALCRNCHGKKTILDRLK
tara:strand:+ start:1533 stop:1961 length:429 start_codon:yes stop_codon:yes gene_type:complete